MPPRGYLAVFGSSPVVARPIGSHAPWLSTWLSMTFWLLFAIGTSALPMTMTDKHKAELLAQVSIWTVQDRAAQICSRAVEHIILAGNIYFAGYVMAALIAGTNRVAY